MVPNILPEPTPEFIRSLAREFDADPKNRAVEAALTSLVKQHPGNEDIVGVLVKVVAINALYSTSIYATYDVAQRITELGLDEVLASGSLEAVQRVAHQRLGGKERRLYSFASKYCNWHRPDSYPITDQRVKEVVWAHRDSGDRSFRKTDLDQYPRFVEALGAFVDRFGLKELGWKELDKGLWILGRRLNRGGFS